MPTPTPPSSPSLGERIISTVQAPDRTTDEQLQQLLADIHTAPEAQKIQALDALKKEINGSDEVKRTAIETNLQTLEEQASTKLTEVELAQLGSVTAEMRKQMAVPRAAEAAPIPDLAPTMKVPVPPPDMLQGTKPPPFIPDEIGNEKKWYKPQTWTPEERNKAVRFAGTGAIVVGGMLLTAYVWKKTRNFFTKTINTVKEKTGKGWKWLKWGARATVLTVVGYFGITAAMKYAGRYAKEKAQAELDAVRQKLTDAGTLSAKEVAALQQKRAELEAKLRQYTMSDAQTAAGTAPSTPAIPAQGPSEASETPTIPEHPTDVFLARAILASIDDESWTLPENAKNNQIGGLLLNNGEKTMGTVLAQMDQDIATETILTIPESDRPSRMKGAELLLALCADKEPEVLSYLMERNAMTPEQAQEHLQTMTLKEYLRIAMMGSAAAEITYDFTRNIEQGQDMVQALRNLDFHNVTRGSEAMRQELESFAQEHAAALGLTEAEIGTVDALKLFGMAAASSVNSTVADRIEFVKNNAPATLEEKIIARVFEEIKTGDTHLYVLPCFQGIFPSEEGDNDAERVRTYMLDRMPPHQALRLFLYRRMMQQGNPTGLVLMQMEVLKFVADADERWFSDKKQRIILRIAKKLAGASGETLQEEWRKLGIELNFPEMFEKAAGVFGMVGGTIAYGVARGGIEAWNGMTASMKELPLAVIGTVVGVGETGRFISRPFITYTNVQEGLKNWGAQALNTDVVNRTINASRGMIGGPSATMIGHAADSYKTFESVLDTSTLPSPIKNNLKAMLNRCTASPHNKALWLQLADEFKKYGYPDATKKARLIARHYAMRQAINVQRFNSMRAAIRAPLRVYERGRSAVIGATAKITSKIPIPKPLAKVAGLVKGTVVLDTAVIGMEAYNYFASERPRLLSAIETETDPMKKAQLERELDWGNTASLSFNGVGTVLLYTPFMPVGVAMQATNAAGQAIRKNIEEGTTYMLKTEKELEQESAGQILQHIGQTAPGQFATWGQGLAANPAKYVRNPALAGIPDPTVAYIAPDMSDTFDEANEGARMEGYRAYFRQVAPYALPLFAESDLSEADQKLEPEEKRSRIAVRTEEEPGYFATAALTYLRETTRGHFTLADPVVLRKAELFARCRTLENRRDRAQPKLAVEDYRTLTEKVMETENNFAKVEILQATDIASLSKHPSIFRDRAPYKLLLAVRHELAACETKILTTNYSNWTNIKSYSWMPGSGHSDDSLRAIARGAYAERTLSVVRDLINSVQSGAVTTPEQITQTIAAMRLALVDGNPNDIAFESIDQGKDAVYATLGNNAHLLSFDTMWTLIQATLPVAPAPAVTPARPAVPPSATPAAAAATQAA